MTNNFQIPLPDDDDKLVLFRTVLRALANDGTTCFNSTRMRRMVLTSLGFKPSRSVLGLLASLRIQCVCPLHLDVARALAADPVLHRRVRGIILCETFIDLMGFTRVRAYLTRQFFTSFRPAAEDAEELWWAAMRSDRAIEEEWLEARRIDSALDIMTMGQMALPILRMHNIQIPSDHDTESKETG